MEKISKEFLKSYKSKCDAVIKEIKSKINGRQGIREEKKGECATRKEVIGRFVRMMMVVFTTLSEIVKVGLFSGQVKQVTQSSVLLDLKNY